MISPNYKIFITGSSGFVGKNLLGYFKQDQYQFKCLLREEATIGKNDSNKQLTWRNLSVTDLDDINVVIHLAGKAHDLKNTSDPSAYFTVNTELTKQLFDVFLAGKAKDFIYFSSVKAAADTVEGILDENVEPNPQTAYGQSKLAAEKYLLSKELPAGKRVFILRPCMIHGPANKGNLNLLYQFVKKGIPYPLAAFNNKRSFIAIDNLCYIIERIVQDASVPSGIYNVADDVALSTTEVVTIISKVLKRKPRLLHISKKILSGIARIGDKIKLPLNSERLQKLTENYVVSNNKIKNALHINALPLSSDQGLIKTIESFLLK